jgi:hypothetical protein
MSAWFAARLDDDPIAGALIGPEGADDMLGSLGGGPCSLAPAGGGASVCAIADVHVKVRANSPDKNTSLYMEEFLSLVDRK